MELESELERCFKFLCNNIPSIYVRRKGCSVDRLSRQVTVLFLYKYTNTLCTELPFLWLCSTGATEGYRNILPTQKTT